MNESESPAVLRVGHVTGVTLTKWRTRWAERVSARLDAVEVDQHDVRRALDAGEVDMCCVRLPIDTDGLHTITLYDEVLVAWVGKDHPIAAFDTITVADLADETVLHEPDAVAIDRVNAGAVLLVPLSVARTASRRDLVHRPVVDAPPVPMVLAWRTDNDNPLIEEFIGIVRGRTANSSRTSRERATQQKQAAEPGKSDRQRGSRTAQASSGGGHRRRGRGTSRTGRQPRR